MERISLQQLTDMVSRRGADKRSLTALAGPPGSGKSTAAAALERTLNAAEPGSSAVLPMDGYHFDDMVLVPRGLRSRKGAPETFDVNGFVSMLSRLRANEEHEIAVPVFDRDLEIARAGARIIPQTVRHLIVEGNYLLLNTPPWQGLHSFFDTTVSVAADWQVLRDRLIARWRRYRLPQAEVMAKVEGNDLPNARLVLEQSVSAAYALMD